MSNPNNAPWAKYGEVSQTEEGEDAKSTTSSSRSAARDIVRSMNQQRYTDLHTQGFVDEGIVTAPVSVSSSPVVDERQSFLRDANLNADYLYEDDHGGGGNRDNVDTGVAIGGDDQSEADDHDDGSNPGQRDPPQQKRNWLKLGGIVGGIVVIIAGVVVALYFTVFNKSSAATAPKSAPIPSPTQAPILMNVTNVTYYPTPSIALLGNNTSMAPIIANNISTSAPLSMAPTVVMNITSSMAPTVLNMTNITGSMAPTVNNMTNITGSMAPTVLNMTNITGSMAPTVNNMTNITFSMAPSSMMNETNITATNSSFTQDAWQQQDNNIDMLLPSTPGDSSGFSVSLSGQGTRLAVGSPGMDSDSGGTKSGLLTIMEDTGNGTWAEVGTLNGTVPEEQFGVSVALNENGNYVAVGSLKGGADNEGKGGAVRVYEIIATSTTTRRYVEFRQLGDIMDEEFFFDYSTLLFRGLQQKREKNTTSSNENNTFVDALMQTADATGIQFDGNLTAYAESLKDVIKNVTESGTYTSIKDGNVTTSAQDLLGLAETLSQPSAVANVGSIFSNSNTSIEPNITTTTNGGDFASMLSNAVQSQGITFSNNFDAYVEQLKNLVQSVAASENLTSITEGNFTISTADFLDLADSLQNSSATLDLFPSNETMLAPTNETEPLSNNALKQYGKTLYHEASTKEDFFGVSLSISSDGKQIAVGAPEANDKAGSVYVYRFDETDGNWKSMSLEPSSDKDDYLGWSVAMSGDGLTLAAGAPYRTNKKPGYVNLYSMEGDSWAKAKTFTPDDLTGKVINGIETDDFGFSVALDSTGNTLVIGSPNSTVLGRRFAKPLGQGRGKAEPAAGYVVVFSKDGNSSEWIQMGEVLVGDQAGGQLGFSVALSLSGTRIVAGAPNHDAGYVHVYNFDGQQWEMAPSIVGADAGQDTGHSVSMSSTGGQISIGSPFLTQCKLGNEVCKSGTVQVFQDPAALDATATPITNPAPSY